MRISDWSSYVCSSDLNVIDLAKWLQLLLADGKHNGKQMIAPEALLPALSPESFSGRAHDLSSRSSMYGYGFNVGTELDRSEERRGGKGGVRKCSTRGGAHNRKKKIHNNNETLL